MKKINDLEYFDITEISEMFHKGISEDELKKYFEDGKIKGKKIGNEWYADNKAIKDFVEILKKERALTIGPLEVYLSDVKMNGRILDIGGGGEAVIGRFKGKQVIAIDHSKSELEEAPSSGALNIIMDGKALKFLDNTFETVSAFFTMMYIPLNDHLKVFQEIHRVLKPDGELFLWDLVIPKRTVKEKDIYLILLKVKINEDFLDAGYGVKWDKEQDSSYFLRLAKDVGFEILEQKLDENIFYLKFKKR